jgi:hypothetical protein
MINKAVRSNLARKELAERKNKEARKPQSLATISSAIKSIKKLKIHMTLQNTKKI